MKGHQSGSMNRTGHYKFDQLGPKVIVSLLTSYFIHLQVLMLQLRK